MKSQENWLKFVISGRVEDYLDFVNSCRSEEIDHGGRNSLHNRCIGDKGDGYR